MQYVKKSKGHVHTSYLYQSYQFILGTKFTCQLEWYTSTTISITSAELCCVYTRITEKVLFFFQIAWKVFMFNYYHTQLTEFYDIFYQMPLKNNQCCFAILMYLLFSMKPADNDRKRLHKRTFYSMINMIPTD